MKVAEREQLRRSCLRYCTAARSMGLGTAVLLEAVRAEGRRTLGLEELRKALRYLEGRGLLQRIPELIENEIWQSRRGSARE